MTTKIAFAFALVCAAGLGVAAQQPPAGQPAAPPAPRTPKTAAPIDITGYWVPLITEDWRWRMLTPAKGDYASVPINPEGRRVADSWDLAKDDAAGLDIGPATVMAYSQVIAKAKTILWNGPMGLFENKQFAAGTNAIAQAVADATQENGAKSIIGGGDSVRALNKAGLGKRVTFMSTGGGASLEFLEGAVLPGVAALSDK